MTDRRPLLWLIGVLVLVPVGLSAEGSPPPAIATWAPVLGLLISVLTLAALLLNLGRWSQRGESALQLITTRLDSCRRECDGKFSEIKDHGSDYSHKGLHDVRGDLQKMLLRVGVEYARKDVVAKEYESLRELMSQQHKTVCDRLETIERRLDGGRE
jgi:hypothetical protein